MDLSSIINILSMGHIYAYLVVFIIMVVEGPFITMAAAFAASLGYANIWLIFSLSFFADLVGDSLDYIIGFYGGRKAVKKYSHIFKTKKNVLDKIEQHFKDHLGETLFIVKMTPLAVPGLILAGVGKVPLKKYVKWCSIIILPRVVFFTGIGYFFGVLINQVFKYYKITEYFAFGFVILLIPVYWLIKKLPEKIYGKNKN